MVQPKLIKVLIDWVPLMYVIPKLKVIFYKSKNIYFLYYS